MTATFTDEAHEAIGGMPSVLGPWQLSLLRHAGLRSTDVLLDLGCGTLRGGLHLIQYLDSCGYVGVDPGSCLIELGKRLLEDAGLADREPRLGGLALLDSMPPGFADFVLTQSVLNHLDDDQIIRTVQRVSHCLAADGIWVSTGRLSHSVDGVQSGVQHPTRPDERLNSIMGIDWFTHVLESFGMTMTPITNHPHPRNLDVFTIQRAVVNTDRSSSAYEDSTS